jgi:hypothetical protein
MLSPGLDPLYRSILATNPRPVHRVEVWRSGVRIDEYGSDGVPILTGSVSATLNSRVTRQASVQVHEDLFPVDETDLLYPNGNEFRIYAGVAGVGGPDYMFQVFRGKIQNTTLADNVTVRASDRAEELVSNNFLVPRNSTFDAPVFDEFVTLVSDGLSDATFGDSDSFYEAVPKLTWENDRAAALDQLANGSRAFWYALANGDFVMRRVPWSVESTPVITYTDKEGGTITQASIDLSREGVINVVTVVGERSDGTIPVSATVSDDEPTSPTFIEGPFGRKGLLIKAQTVTTPAQAIQVAEDNLLRRRTLTQSWATTLIFDPALELGDTALLQARGRESVQVAASFSFALNGSPEMNVSWRAQTPGSEEG